jgi:hypothetical protein
MSLGNGETDGVCKPLSERTGSNFNTREKVFGMSSSPKTSSRLQKNIRAVKLSEGLQNIKRPVSVTGEMKERIQHCACVAIRKNESIPVGLEGELDEFKDVQTRRSSG